MAVTLVGVFSTEILVATRNPELLASIPSVSDPVKEPASKSFSFHKILYYSADQGWCVFEKCPLGRYGYDPTNHLLTTLDLPEINDQQAWSGFWTTVSTSPLPRVNFESHTILLVSVQVGSYGNSKFNVTRVFRSDSPLPACLDTGG